MVSAIKDKKLLQRNAGALVHIVFLSYFHQPLKNEIWSCRKLEMII
jgi:hypothetical protein